MTKSMIRRPTVLNRKIRLVFKSLAVAAVFSTVGCTTWKNVSLVENPDLASRPREIQVVSRGGSYTIHAPVVEGDSLRGWADQKRTLPTAFALSDIQHARVKQVDEARTGLAILGGVVGVLGFWVLLFISSGGIQIGM